MFADTGEVVRQVDASLALKAAALYATRAGLARAEDTARFQHTGIVQTDQWSVSAALNPHRPLHVIALNDAHGTMLYVSSTTGQVVRDTNTQERVLNYFGAVTHWIYPTVLRQYPDAWEWVVDILAAHLRDHGGRRSLDRHPALALQASRGPVAHSLSRGSCAGTTSRAPFSASSS